MGLFAVFVLLGAANAAVHSGYLYDKLCVDRGVGIDGVDTRTEPERHTVHCLLVSVCRDSGYGILTKPGGQSQYSMEVLLSAQGNADVITWLGTQEYSGNDVNVEISGPYDSQGRLHVDTIKRLKDGSVWNGSGEGTSTETSTASPAPSTTPEPSSTSSTSSSSSTSSISSSSSTAMSTTPSTTLARASTTTTSALVGSGETSTTGISTSASLVTSATGSSSMLLATALTFFFRL